MNRLCYTSNLSSFRQIHNHPFKLSTGSAFQLVKLVLMLSHLKVCGLYRGTVGFEERTWLLTRLILLQYHKPRYDSSETSMQQEVCCRETSHEEMGGLKVFNSNRCFWH